jgi:hypothetical protein
VTNDTAQPAPTGRFILAGRLLPTPVTLTLTEWDALRRRATAVGLCLRTTDDHATYQVWERPDPRLSVRIGVYTSLAEAVQVIADREVDQATATTPHPALVRVLAARFELAVTELPGGAERPFMTFADDADLQVLGLTERQFYGTAVAVAQLLDCEPYDGAHVLEYIAWTIAAMTEATAR